MSKIFLVDCENEFNDAFIELYNARKGDEVHFFISPNAHKIDGYLMNKLKEKQIKYWFEECVVDEDNDMGKCLIAFLGVMLSFLIQNSFQWKLPRLLLVHKLLRFHQKPYFFYHLKVFHHH